MIGLVLSGGGARGAYEVGVLSYVFGELARKHGRVPDFSVYCGSSVGAVNATFLAAVAAEPSAGMQQLIDLWYAIDFSMVLGFGLKQIASLPRVWLGGDEPKGIFQPEPLARLIRQRVPWVSLARNVRQGRVRALTVTATHVSTGQPYVFVDFTPRASRPRDVGRYVVANFERIGPAHVLASAAIPLVFPAVDVGGTLYCDGGLRANTPTAPAIHLGAERLFVIGLSCATRNQEPALAPGRAPGAPFLLGKVLDAFFLDHLDADLREVERINEYFEMGKAAFGDDFVERMNAEARARGRPERAPLRYSVVRPSVDLGRIASEHLRAKKRGANQNAMFVTFLRFMDVGEAAEADFASFLLFDAAYVRTLVELGRRDAADQRDELADFFFGS